MITVYDDIDDTWDFFKTILLDVLDAFAPPGRTFPEAQRDLLPGFLMIFQGKLSLKIKQNVSLTNLVILMTN